MLTSSTGPVHFLKFLQGYNVRALHFEQFRMVIWDVKGYSKFRRLWRHFIINKEALIYVIDCSDRERMREATEELQQVWYQ